MEHDSSIVQEFIARRFQSFGAQVIDCFTAGNCYWFAHILCTEFPELKMYYIVDEGHFVAGDDRSNIYYDITGKKSLQYQPISLETLRLSDKTWYDRLMRDCRN